MEAKITKWEDCGRDDLQCIPLALTKGWELVIHPEDKRWERTTIEHVPHNEVGFKKGNKVAWKTYNWIKNSKIGGLGELQTGWKVADLVKDKYENIKEYGDLKELFEKE